MIFRNRLNRLKQGSWTGPVQSGFGYHLIYLTEKTGPQIPEIESIKDDLLRDMEYDNQKQMNDLIFKELKKNYSIEFNLDPEKFDEAFIDYPKRRKRKIDMKKVYFLLLTLILIGNSHVNAHEIRPAYLQIIQVSENSYEVFWKVPSMGDAVPKIQPVFPMEFTVENLKAPNQIPGSVIYYYVISSEQPLQGKEIFIQGLNKTLDRCIGNGSIPRWGKGNLIVAA